MRIYRYNFMLTRKHITIFISNLVVILILSCISPAAVTQQVSHVITDIPTSPSLLITETPDLPTPTATEINTPLPPTENLTPVFVPSRIPVRVIFTAEDGRQLVGYFFSGWKPNSPVVVLMHQFAGDQTLWHQSPLISWLQNWPVPFGQVSPTPSAEGMLPVMPAEFSFSVFTFDFRGHGESVPADIIPDGIDAHASEFILDAQAAYQKARTMHGVNPDKVIGIGASIGADAAVDACTEGCQGVFSISPGSWLGVDYGKTVNHLLNQGKPVRCMYAVNDGPSPATCWSVSENPLYEIYAYPGIKHGMTFVILPRKMEADFGSNLLEFLITSTQ